MPRIHEFKTSDDFGSVMQTAKELRDEQLGADGKVFSPEQLQQDNARIQKTLEFLFAAGPNFTGYIANKMEIKDPRDALSSWVNGNGEFSAEFRNAVKSLVYRHKESGEIQIVVMPNDIDLPKDFIKKAKLERYEFPENEGVVIPRTINPGTMTMVGAPVKFFIHEQMNELEYCCNNLGSRFLSYSVSGAHHAAALQNLVASKVFFNGTTEDFLAKQNTPSSSTITEEGLKALQLALQGDHKKSHQSSL